LLTKRLTKKHFEQVASGFKKQLWDKNHRLQAATVFVELAQELNPKFDSFKFYEACGLVDRAA